MSTINKVNLVARIKKIMVAKETLVARNVAPGGVHVESEHDEKMTSDLIPKRKRLDIPTPLGQSHLDGRGPEVEILSIQEDIAGNSKEKTSLWDSSFDISAHNKACYLMEDNVALLNLLDARRICGDAEGLLSQVTTLVCLANAKLKEGEKVEKKRIEQVKGLQKENARLHQEVDQFRVDSARWAKLQTNLEKQVEDLKENSAQK